MRTRGVPIAERLAALLDEITGHDIPTGALDITLYRDDLMRHAGRRRSRVVRRTEIPFSIDDRKILLVDDVLYTGRTMRAALDALIDFGRPKAFSSSCWSTAAIASCRSRPTTSARTCRPRPTQSVQVRLQEIDGQDEVVLEGGAA